MLNKIIDFSLRNRLTVAIGALLLLVAGIYVTSSMEIDIFPELTAPTVVVMTEAHGMAPEEVERLVTFPIETSVNGSTGIRRVRSGSSMGFSVVWVEFDWGTDIYDARQTVTERLFQVNEQLPEGVSKPVIAPQSSLLGEMMIIALTSDSLTPMQLRTTADWNVAPRLLSVAGVAQVTTIGGEAREYQILADPLLMRFHGITLDELTEACENMNINTSGGFINEHGSKYIVRGIARTTDTSEISSSVVAMHNGQPVTIGDVAIVTEGAAPAIGYGSYRGNDAVLMTITKQPGVNTIKLSEEIAEAINELSINLGGTISFHTDIYNQDEFIRTSVSNVVKAIIEGGIFVVVILFIFLMNPRTTAISLTAIPLSLIASILTLRLLGYNINTMSLGGMAIAIGSIVDDAIIDVENVWKRLRQNQGLPAGERLPALKVIYDASSEIRTSIFKATIIIIITFIPLFLLEGMEGRMMKPLGISFIISLFASLIVALTLTPVMCSYLLTSERQLQKNINGSWVERNLGRVYRSALTRALKRPLIVGVVTGSLMVAAIGITFTFGSAFLPPFNEGALTVNLWTFPGISLEESVKTGRQAEKIMLDISEVLSVARKTGRAELAEHSFGENVSELDVPFRLGKRSRDEFLADVRERLSHLDGVSIEVGQPITHRMDHMLSGSRTNIAIKIFGDDMNELYRVANEVHDAIEQVPGIGDLFVEPLVETPQIKIKARREMLAKYGIPVGKFASHIETSLGGRQVSDVYVDEMRFPLVLRYNDETRSSIDGIRASMIDTHDGLKIPLSFVADIESVSGPHTINRENVKRKIVVSVNAAGRDIGSVVNDIRREVSEKIILPENYRIEYGGQFESAARASRRIIFASALALLAVFIVLYNEFRNSTLAWIVLINLPLALIGGIFAIRLTSGVMSIPSIIGFITLFGIATRNGILLISRYQHLTGEDNDLVTRIVHGSADRLNPILMTALTAALALIPLAVAGQKPGNEIQSPMAVVILGGLLSSTLLNIFVIPTVYYLINRRNEVVSEAQSGNLSSDLTKL
ncbi:MAG: efflux RND transporter permease subunit [Bacteroidales bacterium]|nr:efflux RND transporter permease subunit [Bacteroidales bacterium]